MEGRWCERRKVGGLTSEVVHGSSKMDLTAAQRHIIRGFIRHQAETHSSTHHLLLDKKKISNKSMDWEIRFFFFFVAGLASPSLE